MASVSLRPIFFLVPLADMAATMSHAVGQKSNQVLALDTPLSYDQDNEMIWSDEGPNKELIYLRADGTSVRRQSLITNATIRYSTTYVI